MIMGNITKTLYPKALEAGLITKEDASLIKSFVFEQAASLGSIEVVSVMTTWILIAIR